MTDYVTLLALCDKQKEEIQALKAKVAELDLDVISRDLLLQSQEDKIAELEQNISILERYNGSVESLIQNINAHNLEQQAKALDELLTYPNHRFHGDSRLYYSEYSINRAIENLRKQAKGGDV